MSAHMPGTSESLASPAPSDVRMVCPSEETLNTAIQTNVPCEVPGCGRVFAQPSARRFHMVKVHKFIKTDQDAAIEHRGKTDVTHGDGVRYHCPIKGCKYHPNLGRFFTSIKNLNQHYRHVHAEKKFKCSRCGHGFGDPRGHARHEKTCGLKFVCRQCCSVYNTKDALQTHCSRTRHRSGFSSINSEVFVEAVLSGHGNMTSNLAVATAIETTTPMQSNNIQTMVNSLTVIGEKTALTPTATEGRGALSSESDQVLEIAKSIQQTQDLSQTPAQPEDTMQQLEQLKLQAKKLQETIEQLQNQHSSSMPQEQGHQLKEQSQPQELSQKEQIEQAQPQEEQQQKQQEGPQASQPVQPKSTSECQSPAITASSSLSSTSAASQEAQTSSVPASSSLPPASLSHTATSQATPQAGNHQSTSLQQKTTPSVPPYILPKPDALYMPVQLQINQKDMSISASQPGPVILIVNKTATPDVPRRPVPIAPKLQRRAGPQVKTWDWNSRKQTALVGREMEVQTEFLPQFQSLPERRTTVATSELSVQTVPSEGSSTNSAETQTMYIQQLTVERSSQVSPKARLKNVDTSSKKTQAKHRKYLQNGSQTGNLKRSVCIGTPTRRQKKRRKTNSDASSAVGVQTHNNVGIQNNGNESYENETRNDVFDIQHSRTNPEVATNRISPVGSVMLPQFESVGVGTVQSPSSLTDANLMNESQLQQGLALSQASIGQPPKMISVSTDMSRANISVGTMPSPPLPQSDTFSTSFNPVSMNTIGTDPLPGFSGSSKDLSLSSVFSQETQTSFWAEFQASIGENNATQTMESYLVDANTNTVSLNMPSLMESGVQTSHAQNTHTQTWPPVDNSTMESKSVGVGTSLLNDTQSTSFFDGMETEGLSRSIGIDTQLFDDLFPEVSSRSVAISTPLLDNMDSQNTNSQQSAIENNMFQPIGQRSVGVSPLGHDLADLECFSRSNEGQSTSSQKVQTSLSEGQCSNMLPYDSIATASVQTDTDFELPVFLTAASQTSQYDLSSTNTQTQTVDMFSQFLSNMETQTSSDIFSELNFTDIETQTPTISSAASQSIATAETQTTAQSALATASTQERMAVYIDTETQTLLPNLHLTENSLTDSHTQTTVELFASLVDELEKDKNL